MLSLWAWGCIFFAIIVFISIIFNRHMFATTGCAVALLITFCSMFILSSSTIFVKENEAKGRILLSTDKIGSVNYNYETHDVTVEILDSDNTYKLQILNFSEVEIVHEADSCKLETYSVEVSNFLLHYRAKRYVIYQP